MRAGGSGTPGVAWDGMSVCESRLWPWTHTCSGGAMRIHRRKRSMSPQAQVTGRIPSRSWGLLSADGGASVLSYLSQLHDALTRPDTYAGSARSRSGSNRVRPAVERPLTGSGILNRLKATGLTAPAAVGVVWSLIVDLVWPVLSSQMRSSVDWIFGGNGGAWIPTRAVRVQRSAERWWDEVEMANCLYSEHSILR